MSEKYVLTAPVAYRDVDRSELLSLPGVFKFLQEAAILHANEFDTGTKSMTTRGETWVLNRLAVTIFRYPKFEETTRIETWSRGVKGFKGFREFRVTGASGEPLFSASSLWLYVSLKSKSITRVPADVAAGFPSCPDGPFCPELESLTFDFSPTSHVETFEISVRYSDVDINGHVNNTVYLDYLQTALARAGLPARPTGVKIKYAKSILSGTNAVLVRLASANAVTRFSIEGDAVIFAQGEVTWNDASHSGALSE